MEFTAANINRCMRNHFQANFINLPNVYVYNEESDLFSITKDDYAHEIEVKISKADFKADFKKRKHDIIEKCLQGFDKYIVRGGIVNETCNIEFLENSRRHWERRVENTKGYDTTWKEYVSSVTRSRSKNYSQYIYIQDIDDKILPNKFSFAVPEGLIDKSEVPSYAGLYYINEFGKVKNVKRAKFIHKDKFSNWRYLCQKMYYNKHKY